MTKRREVERDIARRADENAKRRAAEAAEADNAAEHPGPTNPLAEHVAAPTTASQRPRAAPLPARTHRPRRQHDPLMFDQGANPERENRSGPRRPRLARET